MKASRALSMIERVSRSRAIRARLAARRSSSVMTLWASSVRISISIAVHSRAACSTAQNEPRGVHEGAERAEGVAVGVGEGDAAVGDRVEVLDGLVLADTRVEAGVGHHQ